MSDLKQMQFVDNMSTRAVKMAESTYTSARDYTPKMLEGTVTSLEGTLQPYYAKAGDVSSNLLKSVDATVDSGVKTACDVFDGTQTRVKEYTSSPRKRLGDLKADTTSVLSDYYAFWKNNGVKGCSSALVDKLGKTSEGLQKSAVSTTSSVYAYSVESVESSWAYLNEKPMTKPYAAKASELSHVALQYYAKLHDTLVTNALYAKFYGLSSELITKFVTGNAYVTKPAQRVHATVHPYVQYIADPAVEAVSPLVKAVKDHIQPTYGASYAAPSDEELIDKVDHKVYEALPESGEKLE